MEPPYKVEVEEEADGRWIGEVIDIPGCLVYGKSAEEARANARALAFRVMGE